MKWSFYEFGELVNEMRQAGQHDQYGQGGKQGGGSPHKAGVAPDGSPGRSNRERSGPGGDLEDIGAPLDKQLAADFFANAPDDIKLKAKATQLANADARRPDPLAAHDQVNALVGRRRVSTGQSANAALEKALAEDLTKEGQMARQIDQVISKNPKAFASRPMTKMEIIDTIAEMMPAGGIGGAPSRKEIAQGFVKLHDLAGKKLLNKTEDGNYQVNVAVTTGGGSGGVDIESERGRDQVSGTDSIQKVPDEFADTMNKLKVVVKDKGMRNDHAHKLAQRAAQLADSLKRGHEGGISLGGHEEMFQAIQDELKFAKQVIAKNKKKTTNLNDLLGQ